jgi:hypothetical protein
MPPGGAGVQAHLSWPAALQARKVRGGSLLTLRHVGNRARGDEGSETVGMGIVSKVIVSVATTAFRQHDGQALHL